MARRGRQIGDRRDNFSRQSLFLLAMATKTVAAWSAVISSVLTFAKAKGRGNTAVAIMPIPIITNICTTKQRKTQYIFYFKCK